MDGTALSRRHELSTDNLRALHTISPYLTIIPTSGRARISSEQVFERKFDEQPLYKFDTPIVIAFNGTLIYRNGALIHANPIKGTAADDIQGFVQRELPKTVVLVRYSYDNAFAQVTNENEGRFRPYAEKNRHVQMEAVESLQRGGTPPKFIVLAKSKQDIEPLVNMLRGREDLYITWSGSDDEPQLEIMSAGVNKLDAVQRLIEYENGLPLNKKLIRRSVTPLGLEHFVTIGDSDNDFEVLANSGLKIAPRNATQKVKGIEGIITTRSSNDENCVAEAVDQYIMPRLHGDGDPRRQNHNPPRLVPA